MRRHRNQELLLTLSIQIMNWYLAKIVYQIICGDGCHRPQFDEQLRMILAGDKLTALYKAMETGVREEDSFMNNSNKLVHWKFVNVAELYPLTEMGDGAEVYSRVTEWDDANAYTKLINQRASRLENEIKQQVSEHL